ncbi:MULTISPECIES: RHS repeat-associated core domain-containing protein [Pseudomonas syringae group]|nr:MULTISPECIES: RHS repeat-associated core domain-containing protein [Pseudomonas syringae group]
MSSASPVVLCTYHYDATDRLADCSPAGQGRTRLFYQKSRLATQIQGQIQHTLLRTDEHLLAQRRTQNNQSDCALLATDQQQSVIVAQGSAFAYTPYGHRHPSAGSMSLPGYAGQRVDPVTGHYLLGNGYRAFNPVLMRFNSPDSLSPFGEGGVNAYGYCEGDPVNWVDLTGSTPTLMKGLLRAFKIMKPSRRLSTDGVIGSSMLRGSDGMNLSASAPQLSRSAAVRQVKSVSVSAKKLNKQAGLDYRKSAKEFKANDKLYRQYVERATQLKKEANTALSLYDEDGLPYEYDLVQQYKKSQKNLANPIQDLSTPPSYKLAPKIASAEKELRLIRQQM